MSFPRGRAHKILPSSTRTHATVSTSNGNPPAPEPVRAEPYRPGARSRRPPGGLPVFEQPWTPTAAAGRQRKAKEGGRKIGEAPRRPGPAGRAPGPNPTRPAHLYTVKDLHQ